MEDTNNYESYGVLLHHKINPSKDSKFKVTCTICKNKFISTINKNSKLEQTKVCVGSKSLRIIEPFLFGERILESEITFEDVTQLSSVCPNCFNKQEIGMIPSNKKTIEYQSINLP